MNNEPVLAWGTLGTAIGAVLMGVLRYYTTIPDDLVASIVELVVLVIPILIGLWIGRGKVTPVANPKDGTGRRLVPGPTE